MILGSWLHDQSFLCRFGRSSWSYNEINRKFSRSLSDWVSIQKWVWCIICWNHALVSEVLVHVIFRYENNQLVLILAHAISIVSVHYLCMIWYFASFNNCTNCHVFFFLSTDRVSLTGTARCPSVTPMWWSTAPSTETTLSGATGNRSVISDH